MNARRTAWVFGVVWMVALGPVGTCARAGEEYFVRPVAPILAHAEGGGEMHQEGGGGGAHFVRWVGHFHPAMTVFPIAM